MPNSTDQLYQYAIQLPREAQILLVEKLFENIGQNIEPEVEAIQIQEVKKRIQEVREGRSKLIPGDQVLKEVRAFVEESLKVAPSPHSHPNHPHPLPKQISNRRETHPPIS